MKKADQYAVSATTVLIFCKHGQKDTRIRKSKNIPVPPYSV